MRLSLRNWLLLTCFVPVWLLVLLGGGWLLQTYLAHQEQQLIERGQITLRNLAPSLAIKLDEVERLPQLRSLTDQLLESADVRAFSLYDHQRVSLLHAGPSMRPLERNPHARWSSAPYLAVEADTLRFIEPVYELRSMRDLSRIRSGAQPLLLGWAELEISRTPTLLHKYQVLLLAGVAFLVALVASLLLVNYLARHLSHRLDTLNEAFKQSGAGSAPELKLDSPVDELEQLGQEVHTWLQAVHQREEQLLQSIEEVREDSSHSLETIEIKNIELDRARKDALQASRIKSEFLANMSHEVRTPLNGIIGFSNLLSRTPLDSRQKEYLEQILGASETMLGIINDILDFSKIEAGKLVLEEEPVNLRDLLDSCLTLLAPQAHHQQLDLLGLVYDDVPALVRSDPLRLQQLLTNLISNALKFTHEGEVVVRVMLDDEDGQSEALLSQQVRLRISVSDTGCGLNEQQRQSLFQAFTQADTTRTRQFGGTGLGLAICKQLVQQMGGQIDLASEEGRGSTFWFTLPLDVLEPAQEEQPWLRGRHFAVVESHPLTAQAWCHQLRSWGAQVSHWASPETLLEEKGQQALAAAVVGLNSQQATSPLYLEALGRLKKEGLPCLLVLNSSDPDIHARLRARVTDQLLVKPLAPVRLKQQLQVLLEQPNSGSAELQAGLPDLSASESAVPLILAVDDTPSNLLLLATLLQQLGFEALQATSGEEAIERVQQEAVSLILMDIQMPGMGGVQATRSIRSLGHHYRSLPIIALTAHALTEERNAWLQAGINDVLIKPLDENLLAETLHRWLGSRSQRELTTLPEPELLEEGWTACPVDRELGIRLAAKRPELADELLALLLASLQASKAAIEAAVQSQQPEALLDAVHRLHGASRYCGVPELAQTTEALETQLKAGQQQLVAPNLDKLFDEIDRLLEWQKREYRPDWHQRPSKL